MLKMVVSPPGERELNDKRRKEFEDAVEYLNKNPDRIYKSGKYIDDPDTKYIVFKDIRDNTLRMQIDIKVGQTAKSTFVAIAQDDLKEKITMDLIERVTSRIRWIIDYTKITLCEEIEYNIRLKFEKKYQGRSVRVWDLEKYDLDECSKWCEFHASDCDVHRAYHVGVYGVDCRCDQGSIEEDCGMENDCDGKHCPDLIEGKRLWKEYEGINGCNRCNFCNAILRKKMHVV